MSEVAGRGEVTAILEAAKEGSRPWDTVERMGADLMRQRMAERGLSHLVCVGVFDLEIIGAEIAAEVRDALLVET